MDNETPFHQPEATLSYSKNTKILSAPAQLAMLGISLLNLALAMLSVVYVAFQVLVEKNLIIREHIISIGIIIGVVYFVGWIVALVGIRRFHNLILSFLIEIYAWLTSLGIAFLYFLIINRIYEEKYTLEEFGKYTLLMLVAIAGLVGLHLLLKGHSMQMLSFPLLSMCLYHLYSILYYYIFARDVEYDKFIWDILFFSGATIMGTLMISHIGLLSIPRSFISHLFNDSQTSNSSS